MLKTCFNSIQIDFFCLNSRCRRRKLLQDPELYNPSLMGGDLRFGDEVSLLTP